MSAPSSAAPQSAIARPRLEIVVAVAANGVIGRAGQLPWHLPDDLRHFKQLTLGAPVIMGRRTYESIGKPLPGRRNIIISAHLDVPPHPDLALARTFEESVGLAAGAPRAFIIGGSVLFDAALPLVDLMHVTELDEPVEGDACFLFDRSRWRRTAEIRHPRDQRHPIPFRFCIYERA